MRNIPIFEKFIMEKITFPDGDKTTGNKILDKLAKLLNSKSSTVEITTNQVRCVNGDFGFANKWTGFVSKSPSNKFYIFNTPKGFFNVDENAIKKAEDLYSELEAIIQGGMPKIGKESDMFGKIK